MNIWKHHLKMQKYLFFWRKLMFVEILLWPYSCFSYVSYMINTFQYISMIVAECLFYVIAFFICIFSYKKKIRQISDRIDKSRSA